MGADGQALRVVLDTNVVVSALLFDQGTLTWLRQAWAQGTITPLVDTACVDELVRVLSYPKFRLEAEDIGSLLSEYLPFAETVDTGSANKPNLPPCRDPHDQKFLTLAQVASAEALVTGDEALLELAGNVAFTICSPAEFRQRLAE